MDKAVKRSTVAEILFVVLQNPLALREECLCSRRSPQKVNPRVIYLNISTSDCHDLMYTVIDDVSVMGK